MTAARSISEETDEKVLIRRAAGGDERAFGALIEPYQAELGAHCYRMLASAQDAEDAQQDALLRAWRGFAGFAGRSSLRSWLYRVATNSCLDLIQQRKRRITPLEYGPAAHASGGPGEPLIETAWVEPFPDEEMALESSVASPEARSERREGIELAFIAALQHLPPRQRAALILREVLGFSAREAAESLETTVASVNSALQRARAAIDEELPERTQQQALQALGDEELKAIVDEYIRAWESGDVDAVVSMLAADAVLTMPPMPTWYRGEDIVIFLRDWAFSGRVYDAEGRRRVRALPTRANGQPAIGVYSWDPERERFLPTVLQVLSFDGSRITQVDGFVDPSLHPRFGLPAELCD